VYPRRRLYTVPLPDGRALQLGERPLVMGILNVTPDSFAENGHLEGQRAVVAALAMESAGADIIDIGAESTRPGAVPVAAEEELRRLLPVLCGLTGRLRIPISVDTYKADVARAAIAEGASLVNDVSGLGYDPAMAGTVAATGAAVVLMHTRGRSADMYAPVSIHI
jgi:dihydropteroate synthase